MSLGLTPTQANVFTTTSFCEERVAADSIYGLLHRECFGLFPDEMFADLFCDDGRNCVPPMIVAVVMVLQRLEGCSDREAVERFMFDARWKYAAGGLAFDFPGFVHTVLVDMRSRLRASQRPDRIFEVVLETATKAGLVGRRRVLDSTALYDAVATMDTVTLIRSAIRGLLAACDACLARELRGVLRRDDDYRNAGKPVCDYDDPEAREELIDALAKDAHALLVALDGRELSASVRKAGALLATVVGQDLDAGEDGVFRIARRVAKDRVISTVDSDARHGHKTSARGFDGYKGHVAVDPDSELITATTVTAGNVGDAQAVEELLAEELPDPAQPADGEPTDTAAQPAAEELADPNDPAEHESTDTAGQPPAGQPPAGQPPAGQSPAEEPGDPAERESTDTAGRPPAEKLADLADPPDPADGEPSGPAARPSAEESQPSDTEEPLSVYGDSAYGTGSVLERFEAAEVQIMCKVHPPSAPGGRFAKDAFTIDLDAGTVICPAGHSAPLRAVRDGQIARFGDACQGCPLAQRCTTSTDGRTIHVGPHEPQLARARARQADPEWKADYTATRPKVERKISHLMRRKHGGRRSRVRGHTKVDADFSLLAAAVNLARLATLGVTHHTGGWAANTT